MFAPDTVTVYYVGGASPHVTVLEGVFCEAARGTEASRAGTEGTGGARLFIPARVKASDGRTGRTRVRADLPDFLAADDREGLWSLGTGEKWFLVPGRAVEPESSFQALNQKRGAYRVGRVLQRDFGSTPMRHWEAEGA